MFRRTFTAVKPKNIPYMIVKGWSVHENRGSRYDSGVVSQAAEAYARHKGLAGWLQVANDAFHLIGSAVFGVWNTTEPRE
jgi:hypothetical protein